MLKKLASNDLRLPTNSYIVKLIKIKGGRLLIVIKQISVPFVTLQIGTSFVLVHGLFKYRVPSTDKPRSLNGAAVC